MIMDYGKITAEPLAIVCADWVGAKKTRQTESGRGIERQQKLDQTVAGGVIGDLGFVTNLLSLFVICKPLVALNLAQSLSRQGQCGGHRRDWNGPTAHERGRSKTQDEYRRQHTQMLETHAD